MECRRADDPHCRRTQASASRGGDDEYGAHCDLPHARCRLRDEVTTGECSPCARRAAPSRERDIAAAQSPRAGAAARWQRILDLLDPGNAAGEVAAHLRGVPGGLYPRPHDAGKEQANAETGWRGYEIPAVIPYRSSRTDDAQALTSDRLSGGCQSPQPGERRHLDALQAEGEPSHDHHRPGAAHSRRTSPPRTTSHPGQRAGWRRRRYRLHHPPATSGPPLHAHATADETFFVLSGVLLVDHDGQVAAIGEDGLVHVSHGTPHTFATTPDTPACFLMLHTRYDPAG